MSGTIAVLPRCRPTGAGDSGRAARLLTGPGSPVLRDKRRFPPGAREDSTVSAWQGVLVWVSTSSAPASREFVRVARP